MRNFMTVAAVIGLTVTAIDGVQAGGHGQVASHSGSTHSSMSHSGTNHTFNSQFNYGKFGVKSLNYSHRNWSERYGCYQYWCPSSSCWYFYAPSYSCYLPWQYYTTVCQPICPAPIASTLVSQPPFLPTATATTSIPLVANVSVNVQPGIAAGPIGPGGPPVPPQ